MLEIDSLIPTYSPVNHNHRLSVKSKIINMSGNASDAKDARVAQMLFGDCIRAIIDGKDAEVKSKIDSYLANNRIDIDDIFRFNAQGKTLLHVSASKGSIEVVKYIINTTKFPNDLVNLADDEGFTPLINSTISESFNIMTVLISSGASVNANNKTGATALHYAANDGAIDRIKLLLSKGANINAMSKAGTPLHWASGQRKTNAVRYLVGKGADVNLVGPNGPPLFFAAVSNSDETVCALLESPSIDVSHATHGDLNLLHVCAEYGLSEAVGKLLLTSKGKEFAITPTIDGNLPIHLACMSRNLELIETLKPFSGKDIANMDSALLLSDGIGRLEKWHARYKSTPSGSNIVTAEEPAVDDITIRANSVLCNPALDEAAKVKAEELKSQANTLFISSKDYIGAIVLYSQAIALQGDNHVLYSNRSACYMAQNEYSSALVDALVCRRLKPDWSKGAYRVAVARLALGLFEDAAVAAFEGCKLDDANKELKSLLKEAVARGREAHQASKTLTI